MFFVAILPRKIHSNFFSISARVPNLHFGLLLNVSIFLESSSSVTYNIECASFKLIAISLFSTAIKGSPIYVKDISRLITNF